MSDFKWDSVFASGVAPLSASTSASGRYVEPSPPKARTYTPTPLERRKLQTAGDPLEQTAAETLQSIFPEYELLWAALIWDVTDRDFSDAKGQPRNECPEAICAFAEAHYTFFRSFIYCFKLLSVPTLGSSHPLEPYFHNERFIDFYSHLRRSRDMACLLIEQFDKIQGGTAVFRRDKGRGFDFPGIATHLRNSISKDVGDKFETWASEVSDYAKSLHRTAHAIRFDANGWAWILKPSLIKTSGSWSKTLNRPEGDFVPVEEIMKKHWDWLITWASPVWDYFIRQVSVWREDPKQFAQQLKLPN